MSLCQRAPQAPGNAAIGFRLHTPSGEVSVVRGVVNGVYRYDPEDTLQRMTKYDDHLSQEEISDYSQRYVVRVGIDRAPTISVISPVVLGARWADYVVLPEGWTHDPFAISEESTVVNVGDIVEIAIQKGRHYDFFRSLVRKCNEPALEDENPDWNIGCKTYDEFEKSGYAGEYYTFRMF